MNEQLDRFIASAEHDAPRLAELVWETAHQVCARLTRDLPETIAHELADLHLEETLKLLGSDAREQVHYLVKTLGEAEAIRRLSLTLAPSARVAKLDTCQA